MQVTGLANALFNFRGRPTVFGEAECGAEGECENKNIVQYRAEEDEWVKVGEMRQSRILHDVIVMPDRICDSFGGGGGGGEGTTLGPEEDADTYGSTLQTGEGNLGERAALIVGGVKNPAQVTN